MKIIKIILLPLLLVFLVLGGIGYYRYYFVFGEGVKSGELNYVVKKGYIFKTYEGKMIQSGFKSTQASGSIQSNEFIFSIENEEIAQKLMNMGGRQVDLNYREYKHPLPWRGNSEFVVDNFIVKVERITLDQTDEYLKIGDSHFLTAIVFPEDATERTVSWSTTNPNIAEVTQEGKIIGKSKGKVVVTASVANMTTTCNVYVTDGSEVKHEAIDYKEKYESLIKNLREEKRELENKYEE